MRNLRQLSGVAGAAAMNEQSTSTAISSWARRYIETFNLALVPIEPGEKGPKGKGWNKPGGYITDPVAAEGVAG